MGIHLTRMTTFPCYFRICLGWWIFLLHPESQSTGQKNMASRHYLFGSLNGVGTLSIAAVSIVTNPHFKPHSTHSKVGILRQHVFGPPKMTYTAGGCGLGPLGDFLFLGVDFSCCGRGQFLRERVAKSFRQWSGLTHTTDTFKNSEEWPLQKNYFFDLHHS